MGCSISQQSFCEIQEKRRSPKGITYMHSVRLATTCNTIGENCACIISRSCVNETELENATHYTLK